MLMNKDATAAQRGYSVLVDDPGFLLARVNARQLSVVGEALRPLGLRPRSYTILRLAATNDPPMQRDLAHVLELDPSQVVTLVDDLQRAGLVERHQSEIDRRSNVIVATDLGKARLVEAASVVTEAHSTVFAVLDTAEKDALHDALRRITLAEWEEEE
ncbi:MarR family transcriptional regulator [Microbacterium protaetiae]|uniref:MarR family transcriptional regulator n=1 Tax=Microbacterium protaetiae TaxID=2509458 RepID=A0A4P6EAP3_9MICO|nr:MarR family winged helix-turn-helix transcriptional regulator [Microbacterium protaetiae]QAY59165.1 MarR family transcriptional regulator [Microbacterium protaetiae]